MTKKQDEFSQVFERRLRQAGTNSFYADVTVVDEATRTCCVEMEGIPYENVLLYSVEKADLKGFVMIPAIGSRVVVSRIGAGDRWFVEMFSVVDKVLLTIGEKVAFSADQAEVVYKNDKVNLKISGSKVELSADEITLNGGELGGLVKIKELKKNLDNLKTFIEGIHTALPSAFAAIGAALAANGALGKTAYDGAMAGKSVKIGDMENSKVKH